MAIVSDLLHFGDSVEPLFIDVKATALEASKLMKENNVGYLIVEEEGQFSGILSERDIAFKIAAFSLDPTKITVEEIYTSTVITCNEMDSLTEVMKKLKDHHIRHLPVIDESSNIVGLVNQRDIIALLEVHLLIK